MEMIAMLGGLGASGPYMENPSAAARAAMNAVNAAKKVDELAAINAGLPNMGLSEQERLVIQAVIATKVVDLQTPFYKRWWFIGGVTIAAAAAIWHWPKVKRAVGLGAWDRKAFNPTGKLPGARPKAGYGHEDNVRRNEDNAIQSLDEYFKAKRAVARKARKAARKAAKKAGK